MTPPSAAHRRSPGRALLLATLFALPAPAVAQAPGRPATYPARAVRLVLPFPPGGATDIMARAIGQRLAKPWGQQVVVDNRPGASGSIAAEAVARAAPDGHTLFFGASAQLAVNPALYAKLPYDPLRDFAPVTLLGSVPNILVAHPSLPVATLAQLIAFARSRPGQLNYASPGAGSTAHLSAELLGQMTGIRLVHVPYKGAAPGVVDVLGGQVPLMFVSMPSVLGHAKSGRLRALAMTGAQRSAAAPDIPAFAETLPGYESSGWYGVLAPAGTPPDLVSRLHEEIAAILRAEDVRDLFAGQGIDIASRGPAPFAAYIRTELAKWADVVKRSGASAQ